MVYYPGHFWYDKILAHNCTAVVGIFPPESLSSDQLIRISFQYWSSIALVFFSSEDAEMVVRESPEDAEMEVERSD